MYIGVIAFISHTSGPNDLWTLAIIVGAWNLIMLAATIFAIVDSVLRTRGIKPRQLALDAMIVKLVSIPFFLVNFAVLVVLFNASIVLIFIGPILWAVGAIGIVLTYLTMLSTSVYSWAAIAQLRRERVIGKGLTVLYAILSFLFVTDVAAGVLLFGHSRRRPRLAAVWLLVGTGIAMILVGALDYRYHFLDFIVPELGFYHLDWLEWVAPIILGSGVILATAIVTVVRRSTLRIEAQKAVPTA